MPAIGHPPAADLDQRLRRGAGDLEVAELEEVHVGRRVDGTEAAVDREGLDRGGRREALRGHDLEGVAGVHVLDDPLHRGFKLLALQVRLEARRLGDARRRRHGHGAAQALAHLGDCRRRLLVGRVDAALGVGEGAGEQGQLVPQVVEDDHRVGDHQRHVGQPERVGVGLPERLHRADQVVAEEADGAAGERRQPLDRRRLAGGEARGDGGVGIGGRLAGDRRLAGRRALAAPLREDALAPAQDRARPQPDERVAANLALLGGLEQEARCPLRLAAAQLQEGGDGRLAVVDEGGADRNHVALASELAGSLQGRLQPQLRFSGDGH